MSGEVQILRGSDLAEVVLNRPDRRNALNRTSMLTLREAFADLAADPEVAAVLLRGADGFFCSGLDLVEIDTADPPTHLWVAVHTALAALEVPVVVALTGGAINAGAALALSGDLLIVGQGAYVQIKEAEMGMTPPVNAAWLGLRYPASVGLQLALSCQRFSGERLQQLGVALDVVEDEAVVEHARGWQPGSRVSPRRCRADQDCSARRPRRTFAAVLGGRRPSPLIPGQLVTGTPPLRGFRVADFGSSSPAPPSGRSSRKWARASSRWSRWAVRSRAKPAATGEPWSAHTTGTSSGSPWTFATPSGYESPSVSSPIRRGDPEHAARDHAASSVGTRTRQRAQSPHGLSFGHRLRT